MTSEPFELTIESVAFGGKGVARREGKVFFVDDTLPGDRVLVRVASEKARYADAIVVEFLAQSPLRGASPCPVSDSCGGCQWISVAYEQQLAWKKSFVESALQRVGKLDVAIEIIGSPATMTYRNRVHLKGRITAEGAMRLGYFRRGSRDFVAVPGCAIAAPALNKVMATACSWTFESVPALSFKVELQEAPQGSGQVIATFFPDPTRDKDELAPLITAFRRLDGVVWAGYAMEANSAPMLPFDQVKGLTFYTRPGQFQQVNIAHNHTLQRLVQETVNTLNPRRILDVFCGSGNLSLPLLAGQRYVEGIEVNRQAIDVARYNLTANGLGNARYLAGDAEAHLWKCAKAGEIFDLVLLDPPRQGFFPGLIPLKKLAPRHILYVSCDPVTLARDLGSLCKKDYKISRLTALDFFPNTFHVETFAVLEHL